MIEININGRRLTSGDSSTHAKANEGLGADGQADCEHAQDQRHA
jgi:hypothetical protein